jgi:hypothetical protein
MSCAIGMASSHGRSYDTCYVKPNTAFVLSLPLPFGVWTRDPEMHLQVWALAWPVPTLPTPPFKSHGRAVT